MIGSIERAGRSYFRRLLKVFIPAEMAKYVLAGAVAFAADFSVMFSLTEYLQFHYLVSSSAGFGVGLFVSYLLNIKWVFPDRKYESRIKTEFSLFCTIVAIGYLINQLVIWVSVEDLDIDYRLAKVFAACFVLGFNFLAKKLFLFTKT